MVCLEEKGAESKKIKKMKKGERQTVWGFRGGPSFCCLHPFFNSSLEDISIFCEDDLCLYFYLVIFFLMKFDSFFSS